MNRFSSFFFGRYGMDQLTIGLVVFAFLVRFVNRFLGLQWISILAGLILLLALLRTFSRNTERRQRENEFFLNLWRPMVAGMKEMRVRFADRKLYRYFRCPQCGQTVRVPKRKGKIRISCPQCGNGFVKKT